MKQTKKELEKKLTIKQLKFCHELIIDWNGSRAARVAGYSEKTANKIASENQTKPDIQAYIQLIKDDFEKNCNITKTRQLKKYIKIAYGPEDESEPHNVDEKIQLQAMEGINKLMGYYAAQKLEHSGEVSMQPELDEKTIKEIVARL